jgi:hypothetical protein
VVGGIEEEWEEITDPDEVIREGDELGGGDTWRQAIDSVGHPRGQYGALQFRRRKSVPPPPKIDPEGWPFGEGPHEVEYDPVAGVELVDREAVRRTMGGNRYMGVDWEEATQDLVDRLPDLKKINRIQHALTGANGPSQQMIARVGIEMVDLLLRNNSDYGNSAFESPVLAPDASAELGLRVRLSDKIKRLRNMLANPDQMQVDEPRSQTWQDFVGYSILLIVEERLREQDAPQKEEP